MRCVCSAVWQPMPPFRLGSHPAPVDRSIPPLPAPSALSVPSVGSLGPHGPNVRRPPTTQVLAGALDLVLAQHALAAGDQLQVEWRDQPTPSLPPPPLVGTHGFCCGGQWCAFYLGKEWQFFYFPKSRGCQFCFTEHVICHRSRRVFIGGRSPPLAVDP